MTSHLGESQVLWTKYYQYYVLLRS